MSITVGKLKNKVFLGQNSQGNWDTYEDIDKNKWIRKHPDYNSYLYYKDFILYKSLNQIKEALQIDSVADIVTNDISFLAIRKIVNKYRHKIYYA